MISVKDFPSHCLWCIEIPVWCWCVPRWLSCGAESLMPWPGLVWRWEPHNIIDGPALPACCLESSATGGGGGGGKYRHTLGASTSGYCSQPARHNGNQLVPAPATGVIITTLLCLQLDKIRKWARDYQIHFKSRKYIISSQPENHKK